MIAVRNCETVATRYFAKDVSNCYLQFDCCDKDCQTAHRTLM